MACTMACTRAPRERWEWVLEAAGNAEALFARFAARSDRVDRRVRLPHVSSRSSLASRRTFVRVAVGSPDLPSFISNLVLDGSCAFQPPLKTVPRSTGGRTPPPLRNREEIDTSYE